MCRFSRSLRKLLAAILNLAEALGQWPSATAAVLITLLAKPDGGFRPIGLFPMIVRIWTRARRAVATAWENRNARPYFYAGAGKGARPAAWKQALRAEAALVTRVEYSRRVLRLSIASYKLARAIGVAGIFSQMISAMRGITAGSGLATTELRILLLDFCDDLTARVPRVVLTQFVDDSSIEVAGTSKTATNAKLGKAVVGVAAAAGVSLQYLERAKSLGVGVAAGTRRHVGVLRSRLKAFTKRLPLYRHLRRSGVNTAGLVRTGGLPAMAYGCEVSGVSPQMLLAQRRAAAAAVSAAAAGKDLNLSLILADATPRQATDPAFPAHVDVIGGWAEAVWSSWVPRRVLAKLAAAARLKLAVAAKPWAAVTGPAAATVATMARIGWTLTSESTACTDDGTLLNFAVDPPVVVKRHVVGSVRRWQWKQVAVDAHSLHEALTRHGVGAAIDPIRRLLAADVPALQWFGGQRAALRSAMVRGQWTQARLCAAGLVDDPRCRLCVSLSHRSMDLHQPHQPASPAAAAAAATHAHDDGDDAIPIGSEAHRCVCPTLLADRASPAAAAVARQFQAARDASTLIDAPPPSISCGGPCSPLRRCHPPPPRSPH